MMFVLFITDRSHQWRYSTRFNLWLYDLSTKKTVPIGGGPHFPAKTSAASWAPKGQYFAYVQDNDLYTQEPGGQPHRVTTDGTKEIFNAVPDWAYEEEVFNSESVYWCERAEYACRFEAESLTQLISSQGRPRARSWHFCGSMRRQCPSTPFPSTTRTSGLPD